MPTIEQARNWYPAADPVHGFDHVLRVLAMAERLAVQEGADLEIVRTAALLHNAQPDLSTDISGSAETALNNNNEDSHARRKAHHLTSAEFAGQVLAAEDWLPEKIEAVQHAIRAHRFRDDREQPQTLEARILFDADKLDAIGAIGAARAIAFAACLNQPAYAPPSPLFLESGQTQPGEPHSAYHEYLFKLRHLNGRLYTTGARQIGEQRASYLAEFFEQLAAETRGDR